MKRRARKRESPNGLRRLSTTCISILSHGCCSQHWLLVGQGNRNSLCFTKEKMRKSFLQSIWKSEKQISRICDKFPQEVTTNKRIKKLFCIFSSFSLFFPLVPSKFQCSIFFHSFDRPLIVTKNTIQTRNAFAPFFIKDPWLWSTQLPILRQSALMLKRNEGNCSGHERKFPLHYSFMHRPKCTGP